MKNLFVAIGGGNDIGCSCYFLSVEGTNILLDAGSKKVPQSTGEIYPQYDFLTRNIINDFSEIDAVFVSHAHYDHIGSLPYLSTRLPPETRFYTTKGTKELIKLQFVDFNRDFGKNESEKIKDLKREETAKMLERFSEIPYSTMKRPHGVRVGRSTIEFYPAGHMFGASMTFIRTDNIKILYTGDFSIRDMTPAITMLKPDILILNATYGYRPYSIQKQSAEQMFNEINAQLLNGHNVLIQSGNISKQLDVFDILRHFKPSCDVYLDKWLELSAKAFGNLGISVYSERVKDYRKERPQPHILFSSVGVNNEYRYKVINADLYSLHPSFQELEDFVIRMNPSKVFVVHTQPNPKVFGIADTLRKNPAFKGDIVQCCDCEIYDF